MNKPIHVLNIFTRAYEVERREIEEEVMERFGLTQFYFAIIDNENGEGDFLALSEEDAKNPSFKEFLSLDETMDDLSDGSEALEDAAHKLVGKLFGCTFQRVVLTDKQQKLILLG